MAASRLYTLALEHKFTRGRRSMHVVAVCVYVACRQKETRNYMLIDFSDLLQVSVRRTARRARDFTNTDRSTSSSWDIHTCNSSALSTSAFRPSIPPITYPASPPCSSLATKRQKLPSMPLD